MPPLASSNNPVLSDNAVVKAPRRCPKSSLSIKSSGSAPQSTATNFPRHLSLSSWTALATSSFPLPDSPVIKTAPETLAAALTLSRNICISSLFPIMLGIAAQPGEQSHEFEPCGNPRSSSHGHKTHRHPHSRRRSGTGHCASRAGGASKASPDHAPARAADEDRPGQRARLLETAAIAGGS